MSEKPVPAAFPADGRRAIIYSAASRKGALDAGAIYALRGLREFAQHLIIVTGRLSGDVRAEVSLIADEIVELRTEAAGLWAHREALRVLGDRVSAFDEVVLTRDGWFGPVTSFAPTFERMQRRALDIWSLTDRRDPKRRDDSEGQDGVVRLNPSWLAIRRRALTSQAWKRFWAQLPARPAVAWQARLAEAHFSEFMVDEGFRIAAAFPSDDYPAEHPDMFNADLLLDDGCPIVIRDVFDGYPLFFDQHAIVGRRIALQMGRLGYPTDLLWANLAHTLAPKTLHTNGGMLEVLPEVVREDAATEMRVLAVVHVLRADGVDDLLTRVSQIPGLRHVVATLPEPEAGAGVRRSWEVRAGASDVPFELRSAPGRTSPDTAVVFDECRDLALSGEFDLVVAVHTGVPGGLIRNAERYFRRQQVECLLAGPEYIANVFELFTREPGLGLVFPPTPHIGMSTLGDGWVGTRDDVERILRRLDVDVPRDWASPHGPLGGMWIGRPQALRLLAEPGARTAPSAVQTRLHAYVAGELGFHTRTVATAEHASLSHNSLEYTTDHMSMTLYGYPAGYTSMLHRAGPVGAGRGRDFLRMYLRFRRPRMWSIAARASSVGRLLRRFAPARRNGF